MDGVFIGGCRLNECNYTTQGNYHALNVALLSRKVLEHVGLYPERLSIEFMSAGEGIRFADVTNNFVKKIKELGPLGEGEGIGKEDLASRIANVRKLVTYIKIEKKEKLRTPLRNREDEDSYFTREEIDTLLHDVPAYYIDPEKCQACMICARNCPVDAIISARAQVHIIEQDKCIKCGTCQAVCPARFSAVKKLVNELVPPAPPEDKRAIVRAAKEGVA
jgi:Fe-S-cluster-containing hydrogenase component 2